MASGRPSSPDHPPPDSKLESSPHAASFEAEHQVGQAGAQLFMWCMSGPTPLLKCAAAGARKAGPSTRGTRHWCTERAIVRRESFSVGSACDRHLWAHDPPSTRAGQSARRDAEQSPRNHLLVWIIKILCTTVGESFADWINVRLGLGLTLTALVFGVVLAVVLGIRLCLSRYVPVVHWIAVVVSGVAGALYTDILTDGQGIPLAITTSVFAVVLVIVFGVWFARERTLEVSRGGMDR